MAFQVHVIVLLMQLSGQFGVVRKAVLYLNETHTESTLTAVKMLRTTNMKDKDIHDLLQEARIMYQFNHVNVLSIIGLVWQKGDPPLVVMPFMGKGSLLDMVQKDDPVSISFTKAK